MNGTVSLPLQLVLLLRRLVNVFSTFSITHQYLLSPRHSSPSDPSPPFTTWSWLVSAYSPHLASADLSRQTVYSQDLSDREQHGFRSESTPLDSTLPAPPPDEQRSPPQDKIQAKDTIHRLMNNPTLFDPVRIPRYPIVLCHGLYGFDVRGPAAFPSLRLHYWSSVLSILKDKLGAEVIVAGVPATGSIVSRAEALDEILQRRARGRGINLMAHSMGGLDCRHLITHIRPTEYVPLSLTSISTPHRGSPFMDWCAQYLGLGRRQYEHPHQPPNGAEREVQPDPEPRMSLDPDSTSEKREAAFRLSLSNLPSSFTTLPLSLIDSPAYANLTTPYLNDVFNPSTPDNPRVKYFSVASRLDGMSIWHPLWFPKIVLDDAESKAKERLKTAAADRPYSSAVPLWEQEDEWGNDGLVTVQSARWGEFLGTLNGCDHWEIRGARGMEMNVELSGLRNRVQGEGWSLGDWSRFIGTWRKQDKGFDLAQATGMVSSDAGETEQMTQDSRSDPVVKASTDKLSAVFDWIVDHVSTSENASSPVKDRLPPKTPVRNDLATKLDLERFYVALTRRLYDEGL